MEKTNKNRMLEELLKTDFSLESNSKGGNDNADNCLCSQVHRSVRVAGVPIEPLCLGCKVDNEGEYGKDGYGGNNLIVKMEKQARNHHQPSQN